METIGFITTIPVEVIYAAGHIPVDLNNKFITSENPLEHIAEAEEYGFPRNFCSWIKGTFSVARKMGIKKIVMVQEGECTNSHKLAELFERGGICTVPFSYPQRRNEKDLKNEIETFMNVFDVTWNQVRDTKKRIDAIREKLHAFDKASFEALNISGEENYRWLISSSDFNGDLDAFENEFDAFMRQTDARVRGTYASRKKVGIAGIPPIVNNLFAIIESLGGIVVFNEIPRQFAMPYYQQGLVGQYSAFTYPYSITERMSDIKKEINQRGLNGIIHYVQSFCPRQIDDIALKEEVNIPYLTIECDQAGSLDERNVTRIEAFFERL